MGKKKEVTKDKLIEILEKKISDPNVSPRDLASLSKRLANLKGFVKQGVYTRSSAKQEPEPPKPVSQPLCWRRGDLVERIGNRFLEAYPEFDPYALEMTLLPDEIEAGTEVNFSPEKLLTFVREAIWDESHSDVVRELQTLSQDDPDLNAFKPPALWRTVPELMAAVATNQPGAWIAYLKVFPRVTINAGPALSPEEIRDVTEFRAKSVADKDRKKTDLFERFPDRFLHGCKTVSEYDAQHPGEQSILKHNYYSKMPHEWYQ